MPEQPWTVGERVFVEATTLGGNRTLTLRKVEGIYKRFVRLNDGSKWRHDGGPYPLRGTQGPQPELLHDDPMTRRQFNHQAAQARVRKAMVLAGPLLGGASTPALKQLAQAIEDFVARRGHT